jgi:hypothetical protein
MRNSFIHGLWGIYSNKSHWWARLAKCDRDAKLYLMNPYSPKNSVYIFGEDNYKRMVDLGFNCKLIDKRPIVWDMEKEQYRHKIEIWKAGLEEFDSIVFLDWDTVPLKPIPDDFWEIIGQGEPVKAAIYIYHRRMVKRPPSDNRKVSSASFTYIRGKEHVDGIIKTWEEMGKPWKEELALSSYIDKLNGGWKGIKDYKKYDAPFYQIHFIPDLEKDQSRLIFQHCNHHVVKGLLGNGDNVKLRIDKKAEKLGK